MGLYKIHKHNNTDTIIICKKISIQTPLLNEKIYQYKRRYNPGAEAE